MESMLLICDSGSLVWGQGVLLVVNEKGGGDPVCDQDP
jgi:hypothetical protein